MEKSLYVTRVYLNTDWVDDQEDRKFCSGNVPILAGRPITWLTKKTSVALSTMKVEYITLYEAIKKVIHFA